MSAILRHESSGSARRVLLFAVLLVAAGCSSGERTAPPVATPTVTLEHDRVPLGGPFAATFRFAVASDAPAFDQDYRVLVHFLDADDELMWADDHDPPTPTTSWQPGQSIEYTKISFTPIFPYLGPTTVCVGLYSPKDGSRLPLAGRDRGQRVYEVATIDLLPQSESTFVVFKEGWHPAEMAQDNPSVEWQWTRGAATVEFRNPGRDALLYLDLDGRPDLLGRPLNVTIRLGDQAIDQFSLQSQDRVLRQIPVGAAQFGDDERVQVTIEPEATFVPATVPAAGSSDRRELGVRVFHVFVEPR